MTEEIDGGDGGGDKREGEVVVVVEEEEEEEEEEKGGGDEVEEKGEGQGKGEGKKGKMVMMWGYLPGATPQRSSLLSPTEVKLPEVFDGDGWKATCGGGCGFALAISESGKLISWGSTDDLGQSYITSGKHGETPEAFSLPNDSCVVKAAAGWAHCMAIMDHGEAYAWGWKECLPSSKAGVETSAGETTEKDDPEKQGSTLSEKVSPRSRVKSGRGSTNEIDDKSSEDSSKRRKLSLSKQNQEHSTAVEEPLSAQPCLVSLGTGVKVMAVSAGGRHALALSDTGQVWGWGYGGEGQLGLGNRVRMVSYPHLIPFTDSSVPEKCPNPASVNSDGEAPMFCRCSVKAIACGGRHSAVITDTGALLTFGWGLYGQCGQGCTDDELSPTCVSSLLGIQIQGITAGLWHTICTSVDGDVYVFGGNQFGQLGTGADQFETLPKLLEAPCLEDKNVKMVACGARHSAVTTEDGKVFCWGWNKYGQLGLGDAIDRNIPTEVPLEGLVAKDVSCGWWHTLALVEYSV